MRNRIGILSEAYSYATFDDRILATKRLVEEVANFAHGHAGRIAAVIAAADDASIVGEKQALRATFERAPEPVEILMGEVAVERNPYSGRPMLRRLDVSRPDTMPEFGTFEATETEIVPAAYYIPARLGNVLNLLDDHGVRWGETESEETLAVERFVIDSTTVASREYQGHAPRTLFGHYVRERMVVPAGTAMVPMDQPLARLAFLLLEPRSDDGLATWNFLDEALAGERYYPIVRRVR